MAINNLQPVPRDMAKDPNYIEQRQWLENLRTEVNNTVSAGVAPAVADVNIPTGTPDVLGAKMNELLAALRLSGIIPT